MSSQPRFIHLRVHTEYSLLEGAMRVKKLPDMCKAAGMPAVAVTDKNNLFAALEFSVTASGAGVQPIIGCQVDVDYDPPQPGEKPRPAAGLVLLAQNEAGYENLMKLNTCLYVDAGGELPKVSVGELAQYSDGLICLSGGPDGPIGRLLRAGQRPKAEALMTRLAQIYPDRLYVELQRHPG
ncbi:PHP domain-containing protein, partial [Escherichia coli]|nr:PHP domain-containing protein [Escherichia coli]